MKTSIIRQLTLVLAAGLFLLQGCVKETCTGSYTYVYYAPEYKTKQQVRDNIRSNAPRAVTEPGKLTIRGNYIYLNDLNRGIHVIDNTNPAAPRNIAFIDLPGNVDIAVKGNLLYADLYTDLVVLDITNAAQVRVKEIVNYVFPERYYTNFNPDSNMVICNWVRKEEVVKVDCDGNPFTPLSLSSQGVSNDALGLNKNGSPALAPVGINGSLARFALVNDYLYTVSSHSLRAINTNASPVLKVDNEIQLGWGIETIYPFRDKLFIGSTNGMFIYGLQNPASPVRLGQFSHATACDPVIADNQYAYVTLRSGNMCTGNSNQLDVLNINNVQAPQLLRTYPLTNPGGLSKDGQLLFVCDGTSGIRVFNAADPNALLQVGQLAVNDPYDIIAYNSIALVVAKDGLYQYSYSNPGSMRLLSKIPVNL